MPAELLLRVLAGSIVCVALWRGLSFWRGLLLRRRLLLRRGLLLCGVMVLAACSLPVAELPTRPMPRLPTEALKSGVLQADDCLAWFAGLDALVEQHGVRDAMHSRIDGFPYLRTDRWLAMQVSQPAVTSDRPHQWLEQLRQLDEQSRHYETLNLPAARQADLMLPGRAPATVIRDCGQRLVAALLDDPAALARLRAQIQVPDDYSLAMRAAGLYPLTRWPFLYGVHRWRSQARQDFAREPLLAPAGSQVSRYAVPATAQLASVSPDPEVQRLLVKHAPILDIEVSGDADRPGMPVFEPEGEGQALSAAASTAARSTVAEHTIARSSNQPESHKYRPSVNTRRPVMTARVGQTLVAGRRFTQLLYTVWFTERPRRQAIDLLAGRIDALTWRVTLDDEGRPWMYDSIHACGCYHLFFPTERARLRPEAGMSAGEEGPFLPAGRVVMLAGDAVLLRVASGSHYLRRVQGVHRAAATGTDLPLALVDEDKLRSLARGDGSRASFYGPDGLVAGTERAERWLFWPMGIASAGAMRQPGRQSTAFVGRRHFDDPQLFDRYFELVMPPANGRLQQGR